MRYDFVVDTYDTERLKTLSAWSMFRDDDLAWRPPDPLKRGRSVLEQMVHQCVSEDFWFKSMLGIDLDAPPLPEEEARLEFIRIYADRAGRRLERLRVTDDAWWEQETQFFELRRSRAWVMLRRIAHSAHHRGQLTAYLRCLGRELYSTYGPTSDTGGLMAHHAPVVYPYKSISALIDAETAGRAKQPLPGMPIDKAVTERPN